MHKHADSQIDAIIERPSRHPWLEMLARNELYSSGSGNLILSAKYLSGNKIDCVELVSGSHRCRMRAENIQEVNADEILNIDATCKTPNLTLQDDVVAGDAKLEVKMT